MKVLGVELSRERVADGSGACVLVLLDDDGRVARSRRLSGVAEVAAAVGDLAGGDPFLLGVDIPVVVPAKPSRARPVENLIRRRFGCRLPPGGRSGGGVPGESLMAGLATAGLPCQAYPDRDRRKSGLAEAHPELTLKALFWQGGSIAGSRDQPEREELFRAYAPPVYRRHRLPARAGWAEQAVAIDLVLRALPAVEGFDLDAVRDELRRASGDDAVEHVGALLDSILIASTARRYLESPELSLFLGDPAGGYVILPADPFIRRLASAETRQPHGKLFPQASLREMLGSAVKLRAVDLIDVPGRPHRLDATFTEAPDYEFDNRDEMLWWKHCRHLAGPKLPTEGLCELFVVLGRDDETASTPLRLVRSRHSTLSFRFVPPDAWRSHVPTRDGNTYPFRVLRAVYETLPA